MGKAYAEKWNQTRSPFDCVCHGLHNNTPAAFLLFCGSALVLGPRRTSWAGQAVYRLYVIYHTTRVRSLRPQVERRRSCGTVGGWCLSPYGAIAGGRGMLCALSEDRL